MWYVANPVVGAAVAVVFSFVLHVNVAGQPASTTQEGSYSSAAVATLSGLFSRHALAKLKEIFDVAVGGRPTTGTEPGSAAGSSPGSPAGSSADSPGSRGIAGEAPAVPRIVALFPSSMPVTSHDPPLAIAGTGFAPDSVVDVAGTRVPARVGAEEITLRVPAALIGQDGELAVRVRSRGVWSNTADLEVRA